METNVLQMLALTRCEEQFTHQDDKLNETLTTHEDSDAETLSPEALGCTSSKSSRNNLARESADNNCDDIGPSYSVIEQAEISVETRKGKVEGNEKDSNEILDFLSKLDGKTTIVRANDAN